MTADLSYGERLKRASEIGSQATPTTRTCHAMFLTGWGARRCAARLRVDPLVSLVAVRRAGLLTHRVAWLLTIPELEQ